MILGTPARTRLSSGVDLVLKASEQAVLLELRLKELDPDRPVIVCCASGSLSAMAAHRLRRHGFKRVLNAGSWRSLQ